MQIKKHLYILTKTKKKRKSRKCEIERRDSYLAQQGEGASISFQENIEDIMDVLSRRPETPIVLTMRRKEFQFHSKYDLAAFTQTLEPM